MAYCDAADWYDLYLKLTTRTITPVAQTAIKSFQKYKKLFTHVCELDNDSTLYGIINSDYVLKCASNTQDEDTIVETVVILKDGAIRINDGDRGTLFMATETPIWKLYKNCILPLTAS